MGCVARETLTDELNAIDRVGGSLKEKVGLISEPRREPVEPMIEGINTMVHNYRTLLQQHHALPSRLA